MALPVTVSAAHFDPWVIMESGQCFRMVPLAGGACEAVAFGEAVRLTRAAGGGIALDCDRAAFDRLWRAYFDLDTDYAAMLAAAPAGDGFLARALTAAHGLRILRQDPWETLCGFILSQRKNLKAIRTGMEALCEACGAPVLGTARRAFPTPHRLAAMDEPALRALGLGYRAPYLLDAARRVADGRLNLDLLAALPDGLLQAALLTVSGVGVKVADCVMLFAYHRLSRAPVDVWIRRVIDCAYGGVSPYEGYGPFAGVYQQYQFMCIRDGQLPETR
jgi:N-glycosylase/DNA lyase